MRMINPTIATTITMTTTFGSLKLWLATTSAAAMLRWPVPSAMTRLVSSPGPPSNQPIPKPNAINRSPARIPRVPKTCRTLSMFAAVINNTSRMRLTLEIQSSTGFTRRGQVLVTRLQGKPDGEREQHQQDEGASNLPRINSNSREQQRQDDRQITDGDDHQQHHRANGKGEVALGKFSELRQERRAGRTTEQQQSNPKGFVEPEHLRQGERAKGHQDEIGQQSEHDQPGIA